MLTITSKCHAPSGITNKSDFCSQALQTKAGHYDGHYQNCQLLSYKYTSLGPTQTLRGRQYLKVKGKARTLVRVLSNDCCF